MAMSPDPGRNPDHFGAEWTTPMDLRGKDRAVFIISVAAELTGVHPQTLRVYERRGLIAPARTGGMSRRYSQSDLDRVVRIQELTGEGLNLAGVQRVLEMEQQIVALRRQVQTLRERPSGHGHALVPLHQQVLRYEP